MCVCVCNRSNIAIVPADEQIHMFKFSVHRPLCMLGDWEAEAVLTGTQHWVPALGLGHSTGPQHWATALGLGHSTGPQHWATALGQSTGPQHWATALGPSTGPQHWDWALPLGSEVKAWAAFQQSEHLLPASPWRPLLIVIRPPNAAAIFSQNPSRLSACRCVSVCRGSVNTQAQLVYLFVCGRVCGHWIKPRYSDGNCQRLTALPHDPQPCPMTHSPAP